MENQIELLTKLLLHGNGNDGSQVIIDSSYYPKNITVYNNAKNSTDEYKFGTASLKFINSSNDYISILSNNDDFHIGSNDFTLEFQFNLISKPSNDRYFIITQYQASPYKFLVVIFDNLTSSKTGINFKFYDPIYSTHVDILAEAINSSDEYNIETWYHIKICKVSNWLYLFRNGVLKASVLSYYSIYNNSNIPLVLGRYSYSPYYYYYGYLDEIRMVNGIGENIIDFTPPLNEYIINNLINPNCDISLNVNSISGYEDNLDITLNVTNNNTDSESDCLITLDINYDLYDYPYCNNCDILMDIVPEGMFNSTFVQSDYNGDVIIDPETEEPLVETPAQEEFSSCFGIVSAYFQLPDCGDAIEIPYTDMMNLKIRIGINQPIYWSFDIINEDRKYSDPNGAYANLFTENLYIPSRYSRRFIAIVLMSSCGEKVKTLIFPRLVIKEITGTEIISISGIDEISEYLSRSVTLESYCCQESLSKVIPEGQEELDPDLVISDQYTAVSLTNAFVSSGIENNDTQLLLNYNYDLPFIFNYKTTVFTVSKPSPQPLIYGELPGETPIYQLTDVDTSDVSLYFSTVKYDLVTINGVLAARVPVLDINGQYIKDNYGNNIYQYYVVDPRLPVIAISPLSIQWVINNMCQKIIDEQDGDIEKEYFQVNQYFQDFKIYSDINIQNTSIGDVLNNCLGAIPAEYIICSNTNSITSEPSIGQINSWKLNLNIYDIVLDDEKPSTPNWYIPEVLLRVLEHNISRTGIDKFNTINVISPLELGTAQVYPTVIENPPSGNQYVRPIFSLNTGEFLGFSSQFPITTNPDSYYYTSSCLGIAYTPYYYSSSMTVNFGNNNVYVISPTSSSPSTCNIYNIGRSSFYVLTILWNNPVRQ